MQFCHCGECPKEILRAKDYEFRCSNCVTVGERWKSLEINLGRCSKCLRYGFVIVLDK